MLPFECLKIFGINLFQGLGSNGTNLIKSAMSLRNIYTLYIPRTL